MTNIGSKDLKLIMHTHIYHGTGSDMGWVPLAKSLPLGMSA